jgi:hypothetical protein
MNSKERVLTVLNGGIPDRVPFGEFAIDFDTIEQIIGHETYVRAKARSQIAFWEGRHAEVAESYRKDQIELYEKLDVDFVTFPMATWHIPPETDDPPPRKVNENTWEDRYGRVFKFSPITRDITCVKDPVRDAQEYKAEDFLDREPELPERDPRSWEIMDGVIQRFKDEKFICGPSGGEVGIVFLGGMERGMMKLVTDPETVRAATAFYVSQQNLADEVMVHPDQDGVMWGQDFAMSKGPMISPRMFRDLFLDANKARVDNLHRKDIKVIKHCCGDAWDLMDIFLEIGYDCYQSVDQAAGEDLCKLKQGYGDKIPLWGGVDVDLLLHGTPEEVRADVREAMACAKPGGGYIFGTSHSVAVGTQYENFMAMLDEYHKLADY